MLYSTRLCYLSQLAPIWRIVHSELDTPHTSARCHKFCIRMHILRDIIQMCAECLMPNAQSFGSELRIVHSELDTPHTFACHHEGFCIRMHILRDDMQTCAECLMPNAQSFRSGLGYRAREQSRVHATPELNTRGPVHASGSSQRCPEHAIKQWHDLSKYVAVIVSF